MFFTRIPVPKWANYTYKPEYLQESSRYFPLIGWIVGGFGGGVFLLFNSASYYTISILTSMIGTILLTGAFHEDGFADFCDGFGGGTTKKKS